MKSIGTRVVAKPEQRSVAVQAIQAVVAAVRQEEGCVSYAAYTDLEDENAFYLIGEYRDVDAVKAHMGMPHVKTFIEALPGFAARDPEGRFFQIEDPPG